MTVNAFLAHFGFADDPFQSTNASEEPKPESYFVPPPFFPSVLGNPSDPKRSSCTRTKRRRKNCSASYDRKI